GTIGGRHHRHRSRRPDARAGRRGCPRDVRQVTGPAVDRQGSLTRVHRSPACDEETSWLIRGLRSLIRTLWYFTPRAVESSVLAPRRSLAGANNDRRFSTSRPS